MGWADVVETEGLGGLGDFSRFSVGLGLGAAEAGGRVVVGVVEKLKAARLGTCRMAHLSFCVFTPS